jgi:CMP/dCMP kinase
VTQRINIAIDGFSSTGKSTLARQLAAKLGYTYIDSGAMYRAITLYFLDNAVDLSDTPSVLTALSKIHLSFSNGKIMLNGHDVESEIRTMAVANLVSEVAAIHEVRLFAVAQQQQMGKQKGVVMDGRDIGTTVFPDAELKIYVYTDPQTRAIRRFEEMQKLNPMVSFDEVSDNLRHRDHIDSTRVSSPLRQADDAVMLDNTSLSMDEQLQIAYEWVISRIQA